jgi:uncharacterized protein YggE
MKKSRIKDNQPIIITSIIAGMVLLIALLVISFGSFGSSNKITVEGIASIDAMPDLMSVYFMIETQGKTSAEAKDANDEILDNLVIEILGLGFERSELQTQGFNIYPNYEWDGTKRTRDGYRATHSLKLELSSDEFDKISEVIDAGADSGAGVSYINFELSQGLQNQYKAEALELASKDAQIKADAVASGFGKRAGRLVSVQVSDFGYYPWNIYTAREDAGEGTGYATGENAEIAKQAVAGIEPGEQEITARVSATFRII